MFMKSLKTFFIVFINSSVFSGDLYFTHLIQNSMHGKRIVLELAKEWPPLLYDFRGQSGCTHHISPLLT